MISARIQVALLFLLQALTVLPAIAQPDLKKLSSYAFDGTRPLADRVEEMPPWLLKAWREMDESPQYRPYHPTKREKREFDRNLAKLPAAMTNAMKDRLIAFYFIENLKGNGLTDWVLDASSRSYVYVVINPVVFRQSLSQTIAERDRSAFRGSVELSVDAGAGDGGIVYALAHEALHAFDYIVGITPFTEPDVATLRPTPVLPWEGWSAYDSPLAESSFAARPRLRFYGFKPPELEAAEVAQVYHALEKSPFVSLYATRNWADDAAELFVFQHLTRTLGRPYRIRVRGKDGSELMIEPMESARVRERATRILKPLGMASRAKH